MKRREFTALFASVAPAEPIAASVQSVGESLPHWIDRQRWSRLLGT